MADRPKITEADRKEIQNRINESLDYILNGQGAYWPDGGQKSLGEIVKNLRAYRLSLPEVGDVDDPAYVYRSTLLELDEKLQSIASAAPGPQKFPDNHIEVQPPDPSNPQPSPKDILNRFNNPISFENQNMPDAGGVLPASTRPLLGPFSGEPMSLRPIPPQVFGLPDKSDAPDDTDRFKFFAGLGR